MEAESEKKTLHSMINHQNEESLKRSVKTLKKTKTKSTNTGQRGRDIIKSLEEEIHFKNQELDELSSELLIRDEDMAETKRKFTFQIEKERRNNQSHLAKLTKENRKL